MDRPESADAPRGAGRASYSSTWCPRRSSSSASNAPVGPAPAMRIMRSRPYCLCKDFNGTEDVRKRVVQRDRRQTQHVGFPPIADHPGGAQALQTLLGLRGRLRNAQTELASALLGRARRYDLDGARQTLLDEPLHESGKSDGFPAQSRNAGALKYLQRREQRCRRQNGRVADLPPLRAFDGIEPRIVEKSFGFIVAPPAGKSRQLEVSSMALMHEATAHGAGSGIEIFITAPHGEIAVPVMQAQRRVADGACEVDSGRRTRSACSRDQCFHVQDLAGEILNSGQQHQRQSRPFAFDELQQVLGPQVALAGSRFHLDQVLSGGQSVKFELRNSDRSMSP